MVAFYDDKLELKSDGQEGHLAQWHNPIASAHLCRQARAIGATARNFKMSATARKKGDAWHVGAVKIHAPRLGEKQFWIYADIAELFGCEYTSEAVARFRTAWKQRAQKLRISIDAEADGAGFSGGRDAIVQVAALLNELAGSTAGAEKLNQELSTACDEIAKYIVPKPLEWKLGDVFAFELADGTYGYGQVVGELRLRGGGRQATCALFDHRTTARNDDVQPLQTARVVTVLHVQHVHLAAGEWRVLGTLKPRADPYKGPCGHPFEIGGRHWNGLEVLANAFFGLTPWNAFAKETYLDGYLLPGITRPANAVMLDEAQRAARGIKR